MALGQQYAVSGRRVRPSYTDIINQQTGYLPAIYRQKAEEEHQQSLLGLREKELGLQEKGIEEQSRQFALSQQLEQEALEEQKKQARKANLLAGGNLALRTGLGLYGEKMAKQGAPAVADTAGVASKGTEAVASGITGGASSSISPTSWTGKATDWGKWGGAATSYEPWAGGMAGGLAANILGKDAGTTKKALIGGGVGAAVSARASGGDIYKSIVGGVLGGLGGLF